MTRWRTPRIAAVAAVVGLAVAAGVGAPPAGAAGGTLDGFTTTDFTFVNALQTTSGTLGQLTFTQSAAGASTEKLTTKNKLGEKVLDASPAGKNAFGHGAGVSANLGADPGSTPQIRETLAEATSPPKKPPVKSSLVDVPAAPLATASVLPSTAEANTTRNTGSPQDFCPTVGGPISVGTANVAEAALVPSDDVAKGFALANLDSAVHNTSIEALRANGAPNAFGLSSASTLNTTGLTLFKGIDGAETDIRIVAPVTLDAFAAGLPGKSKVSFGDNGNVNVVKITTSQGSVALTLNQLLGGGATIDLDGLLKVHIGLAPTTKISPDGTVVDAVADLVQVQVVGARSPSQGSVGGPLGGVLTPILGTVFDTLDQTGIFQDIDDALQAAGLTTAVDLRIGHFEAHSQVPPGGVVCELPVSKTADKDVVKAGDSFVYTITVDNPFACPLNPVKLVDDITATDGVTWHVTGTDPTADSVTDDHIVWNNIGPIPSGKSKSVTITVAVPESSGAGRFTDHAAATGTCKGDARTGNAVFILTGEVTVHIPDVVLPATGGTPLPAGIGAGLAILGVAGALLLRRRRA